MDSKKKIHLIGIGGIGISALARLYVHEGKEVSGTNDQESPATLDALRQVGVPISLDTTVVPDADLYVYSDAWTTMHPELIAQARATGKPTKTYFEALADVANDYYLIAVTGTHGKTTTTAMLTDILSAANLDPSAVVGSLRAKTKSNFRAGKSKYFIVEACEYRRHFLYFRPEVLVITNVEHEHVDYFRDLADVQAAFRELAERVPTDGAVIADVTNPAVAPMVAGLSTKVIDYKTHLDLSLALKVPGLHNRQNAAAADAAAAFLGIAPDVRREALENFAGTMRRFEYKGEVNHAPVYDDYAHHPTELRAAIQGARELYPNRRLTVVFQPHTYSRTKGLFAEFARAVRGADRVIVAPIYAAREAYDSSVTSRELAVKMLEFVPDATYIESFADIEHTIRRTASNQDVIIVMGAGDITAVATALVS